MARVLRRHLCGLEPMLKTAGGSGLVSPVSPTLTLVARKSFKYFPDRELKPPEKFENVVMPERHRLPIMPKVPQIWQSGTSNMRPPRQTKELWRMKGEELVQTDLQLNQYGIVALTGGMIKHAHFEVLRNGIGRKLVLDETFALYRVDPPYKPITHHGEGKRMGGGKGSVSEYGTPVRAGRVIVEVGGKALWEEVQPWLAAVAAKLPFDAMAVNTTLLNKMREEEQRLEQTNLNPTTFEWLVRNNMFDCQRKLSVYDKIWFGKFVYLDRHLNKKWQWVTKNRYKGKF